MRVLIVSTWYPSPAAPIVGSFVRADAELLAQRHDVEVVHLAPPAVVTADECGSQSGFVTRVPMATRSPRDIMRAWNVIRSGLPGFDVVHTHAFSTLLPFVGHRVEIPWVHTEHWSGVADPGRLPAAERAVLRATGRSLNRPDVVIAVSEWLAERVRAHRRREIAVVPPAVAPVTVTAPPGRTDDVRLVGVGGLVPGKDPLMAVEIVRELRRRGVPARMEWAGDGTLRPAVEAQAGDHFTVLGALDRAGVGAALDRADLFLLPTLGETLCLSALEAVTHGRPVVMGSHGGQRGYVTPVNGRLVGPRDAAAYADAVQSILAQRPSAAEVAATLGDRFHPETVLNAYERVYDRARRLRAR